MRKLEGQGFSLEVVGNLEKTFVLPAVGVRAWSESSGAVQSPEFTVRDSRVRNSVEFQRWVEQSLRTYCDAPQKEAECELEILGKSCPWLEYADLWEWEGKSAQVHYFLSGFPRSGQTWLVFQAFCESAVVESFRGDILSSWTSLELEESEEKVREDSSLISRPLRSVVEPRGEELEPAPVLSLPSVEGPCFRLGGFDLGLKNDLCGWSISKLGGDLALQITPELNRDLPRAEQIFSEYARQEELGFRFTFSGIHQAGVPTGHFSFVEDSSQDRNAYLWKDGWNYSLDFTGSVRMAEGWVAMRGVLGVSYEPRFEALPLEVYLPLSSEDLDWADYSFRSLEETEGCEASLVRSLAVQEPELRELGDKIWGFQNLERLTVSCGNLERLDERIGRLQKLRELSLCGGRLSTLPTELGRLQLLERFSASACGLERVPEELWRLPNLQSLDLSANALTELSECPEAPELRWLDLGGNRLKTLSEAFLKLPKLEVLKLSENPWKTLPQECLNLRELDLSHQDKLRLFDYSYPGAKGQGIVSWKEEPYWLRSDRSLEESFDQALEKRGLSKFREPLRAVAKTCLSFQNEERTGGAEIGRTRFGGWPDLPKSWSYPSFHAGGQSYACEFVAQLNCEELARFQGYLPRSGVLYFFIDHQESFKAQVYHYRGDPEELIPSREPSLEGLDFWDFPDAPYGPCLVKPFRTWSLPDDYSSYCNTYQFPGEAQLFLDEEGLLAELKENLEEYEPQQRHEVNAYVFTQHESPELQAAQSLRGRPEDWMVLLKVASLGDFQWWDAGELFFVIHKSDLAQEDFSQIFCGIETS